MDIGFGELLVIFVLSLGLFGPKNFPKMIRSWGRTLHRFKREIHSFLDIEK